MTDHDDSHLERSLLDALDSSSASMPESAPPTFSWQSGATAASRRVPRRAVYAGSGLVAAAVAAAVVATTLSGAASTAGRPQADPPGTGPAVSEAAPTLLLAAAHLRLRTGDPVLKKGQFRYVRIVGPAPVLITYAKGSTKPITHTPPKGSYSLDQYWIPRNETHVWLRRSSVVGDPNGGPPSTYRNRCDDLYAKAQDGPMGPACTRAGSFSDPTPAFIAGLPRNADALYARLHEYAEKHLNPDKIHSARFEMFTLIDSLLDGGVITSELTSTLYTVLSRIPGIVVIDGAKNYSGVAGTGFRLSTVLGHGPKPYQDTQTIIVDRHDGSYLGDKDVAPGLNSASAVTTGVADRIGKPGK